jgi:exodeoxyribonuclease-3
MRIVTWNVNSIQARLPVVQRWVREHRPDVLLLQELKCQTPAFPYEAFDDLGYACAVHGQKTYNGVAILSKGSLEGVHTACPQIDSEDARFIAGYYEGILVASVYVPNGQEVGSPKYSQKLTFLRGLRAYLADLRRETDRVVVGGDFNVAPFWADVHPGGQGREEILTSLPEREALRLFLTDGWVDALRALHPEGTPTGEALYSWWDYRARGFEANRGFRIDHLLVSPVVGDSLLGAGVDTEPRGWERPSDHAPVWIEIKEKV